jgi:hypothetical protein
MQCSMFCCAVLCCAMLCCAVLCYTMLCYAMLCYAMLCYAMLCYAMLCYAMLCYGMLCYVTLRYVTLCYVTLQCRYDMIDMIWYLKTWKKKQFKTTIHIYPFTRSWLLHGYKSIVDLLTALFSSYKLYIYHKSTAFAC